MIMKRYKASKIAFEIDFNKFDFSHARVRYDGRSLTRFDIAYFLDLLHPLVNWKIIYDVYSYSDLRNILINYISEYED